MRTVDGHFTLTPQKLNDRIVHRLDPLNASSAPLKPGDVIAVRLTLSGGPWRYLMTEDPIPAGTEFIERDNLYELRNKPPWWQYWFTRREMHDDRMAIFQTNFWKNEETHFYLLKVVNR